MFCNLIDSAVSYFMINLMNCRLYELCSGETANHHTHVFVVLRIDISDF